MPIFKPEPSVGGIRHHRRQIPVLLGAARVAVVGANRSESVPIAAMCGSLRSRHTHRCAASMRLRKVFLSPQTAFFSNLIKRPNYRLSMELRAAGRMALPGAFATIGRKLNVAELENPTDN
jgi:hypothetical protein